MSTPVKEEQITVSLAELDLIIRRAVREAVHEELSDLLKLKRVRAVDDWTHEGEVDPGEDEAALEDALASLKRRSEGDEGWQSWEEFKSTMMRSSLPCLGGLCRNGSNENRNRYLWRACP